MTTLVHARALFDPSPARAARAAGVQAAMSALAPALGLEVGQHINPGEDPTVELMVRGPLNSVLDLHALLENGEPGDGGFRVHVESARDEKTVADWLGREFAILYTRDPSPPRELARI